MESSSRFDRWVRAHPVQAAVGAMLAAVLFGAGIALAVGSIRGTDPATGAPGPSASERLASDAPTQSPADSTVMVPSPVESVAEEPSPTSPSATATPASTPVGTAPPGSVAENGRIAWDAPTSSGGGTRDVVTSEPDGSDLRPVADSPAEERNAVFSPDGRWIAYISSDAGGSVEIVGVEHGERRVVYAGGYAWGTYYTDGLAWSPDSARLALALVSGGVQIVGLDGGDLGFFAANHPRHVAWSPSGGLLAYVDGGRLIVAHERSGPRVVVTMATNVRFPNWSPDERTILFHGYADDGNTELFSVNLDGSELRNVTGTSDLFEDVPVISPDGESVAVVVAAGSSQRVDVMRLDGTDRRTALTMAGLGAAAWAPDGTALVVGHGERITVVPLEEGASPFDIGVGNAPSWGVRPAP